MIDALRYEGVRIRTIGSTYWTVLIGLGLCALVALGFGIDSRGTDLPAALSSLLLTGGGESLPFPVLGMAVSLIGILATGHEYRHRMIYPTLTAIPRCSRSSVARRAPARSTAPRWARTTCGATDPISRSITSAGRATTQKAGSLGTA